MPFILFNFKIIGKKVIKQMDRMNFETFEEACIELQTAFNLRAVTNTHQNIRSSHSHALIKIEISKFNWYNFVFHQILMKM